MITERNPQYIEWQKDEIKRLNLASLLKDPTLLEAISIIRRNYQPSASSSAMKDPVVASATHHLSAGAFEAMDDLFQLATETKKISNTPPPKEWAHLVTTEK